MKVKKAVLFGINYTGDPVSSLNGCINDAENLQKLLTENLGYQSNDVLLCTDNTPVKPTKSTILRILNELCLLSHRQHIDQVFISYSGHGVSQPDTNGDEKDNGNEEALVPLDYKTSGYITDDELGIILKQMHPRTDCIVLIDACHSGTAMDFPYRYISGNKYAIENDSVVPCRAVMISGCQDDQKAQEVWSFNDDKKVSGLMTSSFIHALEKHNYDVTCFKLIKYMQEFITSLGSTQKPQLCTSRQLSQTCAFITDNSNAKPFFIHQN